ncbi:hypothetical protein [Streptomyces sp. NRRL B-24484]|uniref:hypothetical protein n=1 Tax=Streptomyces sp. NRRL B-24484 TaxID=1463833 RepID=UPI0004C06710|nr:hypothetical protein [Streptomyces sp. NRRL B-24484]
MAGIVRIDCTGLSLETVVAEAMRSVGETGGAEQLVLDRVGAAGPLLASVEEPARVRLWARHHAREQPGVPVVVGEAASAAPARPVRLAGLSGQQACWLQAVAASETFRAPVAAAESEAFAEQHDLLVLDSEGVGLTGVGEHRARAGALADDCGSAACGAPGCAGAAGEPAAAGYLRAARPVHAVLAGELGEWLADPGFLVDRTAAAPAGTPAHRAEPAAPPSGVGRSAAVVARGHRDR